MPFYSPSSLSLGHPSYLPRRSYRPASFYEYEEPSGLSAFALEDLAYSPLRSSTFPARPDPETRYRRALHELEAAEQEYEAHVALERAREVGLARQRAAVAEAARREHAQAIQAEIERVEHARAVRALIEERLAQRQHSLQPRVAFGGVPCQGRGPVRVPVATDEGEYCAPHRRFAGCPRSRYQRTHSPTRPNNEGFNVGDLLELLAGVHSEHEPASSCEKPTSTAKHQPQPQPQPQHQPQPQPQPSAEPAPPKRTDGEVTLNEILEFIHGIGAQVKDAAGKYQSTHERSAPSQPEAAAPAAEKGKGKAKAEPTHEAAPFQTLFRELMNGALPRSQEMRDIEQAIELSLQDRDTADAKKAHASKTRRSSPGASSSKVTIQEPSSSGRAASPARSTTSTSSSTAIPQPPSPLTSIRAVRSQFSALESGFKFPPVLDFDHSELAVTPNTAPVRAYEQALNGLLEQLDAIESDGDEEVREVRREVVREVERALEEIERKVRVRAPQQAPVPEVTKEVVNGYDIESGSEEPEAPVTVTEDLLPADVAPVVKDVKPALLDLTALASPADVDIDLAIYKENRSASAVAGSSEAVAAEPDSASRAPSAADGGLSTLDTVDAGVTAPTFVDPSDSIATITPAYPAAPVPTPTPANGSPDRESFLTSMSHDQFTFPPKPSSQSSTGRGEGHDDAILVDASSEGENGSVKDGEDGWSEV